MNKPFSNCPPNILGLGHLSITSSLLKLGKVPVWGGE